ncbi:hypothetical protein [Alkalicoccobacillus porphyridii]|nr:hypothetical protein [Alkalicoccobacillus porphyridii]
MIIDQIQFLQIVNDFEEKLGRELTSEEIELLYTILHKQEIN